MDCTRPSSQLDQFNKLVTLTKTRLEIVLHADETNSMGHQQIIVSYQKILSIIQRALDITLFKDEFKSVLSSYKLLQSYKSLVQQRIAYLSQTTSNKTLNSKSSSSLQPDFANFSIPGISKSLIDSILGEITPHNDKNWDDIAGLESAKKQLIESVILPSVRPDLFQGLRSPAIGVLLYGPPGCGKTMIARAVASASNSTCFVVSSSALTSKFVGEGSKLVKVLFKVAQHSAPSIIFFDEIDAFLSKRSSDNEHPTARQMKNEFLIQFSETEEFSKKDPSKRVVFIAATNRPLDLDEAFLRRLPIRIYIPLPDPNIRKIIFNKALANQKVTLSKSEITQLVQKTQFYSASELIQVCRLAVNFPLRKTLYKQKKLDINSIIAQVKDLDEKTVPPATLSDFLLALKKIQPIMNSANLKHFSKIQSTFSS